MPRADEPLAETTPSRRIFGGDGRSWAARDCGSEGRWRCGHGPSGALRRDGGDQPCERLGWFVLWAHSNLCVNDRALGKCRSETRYLPRRISGGHVGALEMSEPGSDVLSMKLRTEKRNDRFVVYGGKMWITNAPDAATLVIYAKTDVGAGRRASPPC